MKLQLTGGDVSGLRPYVFETAWEVVNKVGGIYTVIKTKAGVTVEELGDHYYLLGPYNEQSVRTEVEVIQPENKVIADVVASMREKGVKVIVGRWLIDGYPQVILFDINSHRHALEAWKKELWDKTHISTNVVDSETDNAILFGFIVTWFLSEFRQRVAEDALVIAHFHEWLSAVGLIMTKMKSLDVATLFTTHATLLGRYLCAGQVDFYNNLPHFDVDKEAGDRGIYHRYCLERAGVSLADIFTTVSQITAVEAEHLLKKKPDVVTPNGLNVVQFSALHEFQNLHAKSKDKIHEFIRGHFHGHFNFKLDKTLYFFIAGRYEYFNKGADMFIESLARLNYMLQSSGSDYTVVAFIIMPTKTNNFNVDSLKSQASTKQLREIVNHIQGKMGAKLFEKALMGEIIDGKDLLDKDDFLQLKRCIYAAQRPQLPPVVTHNVVDSDGDLVLNHIRRVRLFNDHNDRVKVIFHPEFLSPTNALFSIDYEEFIRGCHLGVFPSYYEPWGYTPAECTVMGIPSVTTNLSGFGSFMGEHLRDPSSYGIYIVDRRYKGVDESIQELADILFDFCKMSRRQRIIQRNRTERLSDMLDWKSLGIYYKKARYQALRKKHPEAFLLLSDEDTGVSIFFRMVSAVVFASTYSY
ncbi:uncharacterized protein TRIADDRAFT_20144 [Trichoplax adhaerens]|uniref:Glycogen [starch] synthase n=1 Tax=Trichoplax adhaerens TaxID=10228 RepID=B3RJN2_TRIAD|nr:hypothetical protein TRIADDRAFT_20144 [Trichoplax adhaerens]EDV29326.1 hypothetical protein TRIADDRAFT_20144 [Trichoplax adhaerens]|eukprot:XP_002108528.1 hypothetical protein TRIADDRAFT_20144 [Trichoplax adhaerens]